jgi:signal transduction histidine kinase/ActR/RegA family two-component response regulator
MLLIALVPALLVELGLAGYFADRCVTAAEQALAESASDAAHHLAATLPDALAGGNEILVNHLLQTEQIRSQLAYVVVVGAQGRRIAAVGDSGMVSTANPASLLAPSTMAAASKDASSELDSAWNTPGLLRQDGYLSAQQSFWLPAPERRDGQRRSLKDSEPLRAETRAESYAPNAAQSVRGIAWGQVAQLAEYRRHTFIRALLLVLSALTLTGMLAWHLSNWLAGQLRHMGEAVERIAQGDLQVRAEVAAGGEIGTLAAGINQMAEVLQANQSELEIRITHATADLAAKKEEAERANIAKSRFFAAASHDLRQPLHALTLFVTALRERNQQPETKKLVDNIEASTAAMELLFNALLDISKLDAGVIEVHPVHFPAQHMLDDLRSQFAPVAKEKGLQLRIRNCPGYLYGDPLLLERVLINLVSNAIRYSDRGGVLVGCRPRRGSVQLSVWDTGRGIPVEQQQNVFQEFVQLHNPERDRSEGLGLGLAIVSRLGRLLGHRIGLRSRPNRGSVFTIDVPPGNPRLAQISLPSPIPGTLAEDALVVLVDDEEAILQGMAELFDNWKLDLVAARSAEEALHLLEGTGRTPDVIVSDYRLPGNSDGLQVIARLREHFHSDIPAVLVTGDTAPGTIQAINQAGFPILHKPLRPAKLRALLTHLIRQGRASGSQDA